MSDLCGPTHFKKMHANSARVLCLNDLPLEILKNIILEAKRLLLFRQTAVYYRNTLVNLPFDFELSVPAFRRDKRPERTKVREIVSNLRVLNDVCCLTRVGLSHLCVNLSNNLAVAMGPNLRHFRLYDSFLSIRSLIQGLAISTGLRSLILLKVPLSNDEARTLGQNLPTSLVKLMVRGAFRTDADMSALANGLGRCPNLEALDISNPFTQCDFSALRGLEKLTHFGCSSAVLNTTGLWYILDGLRDCQSLTWLDIETDILVDRESLDAVALTEEEERMYQCVKLFKVHAKLSHLRISGFHLHDSILQFEAGLLSELSYLELSVCWIDSFNLLALLVQLERSTCLRVLDVQDNFIDCIGIRGLVGFAEKVPSLQKVCVEGNDAEKGTLRSVSAGLHEHNVALQYEYESESEVEGVEDPDEFYESSSESEDENAAD